MVGIKRALSIKSRIDERLVFWGVLALGVILTAIGIWLGNPFEDYQTASTL